MYALPGVPHEMREIFTTWMRAELAERAGPGEQVDHAASVQPRRPGRGFEHIEQRLAGAVGGRAGGLSLWRHKRAATKRPGNDPHAKTLWKSCCLSDDLGAGQTRR